MKAYEANRIIDWIETLAHRILTGYEVVIEATENGTGTRIRVDRRDER